MTKAFGYLRVSGKDQESGDGFPRQREAISAYAASHDVEIVQWFEERAITGDSEWEDRPAWSAMIGALNGVRTILIERLDRLARQMGIQEYILRDLRKREIVLITALGEETGNDDPVRVAMRQMLGVFAQYDKSMIVKKLKAARDRKKRDTGRCEGRKPFGLLPGESERLERMQGMRLAGATFQRIADSMNAGGYAARHGGAWSMQTVGKILGRGI